MNKELQTRSDVVRIYVGMKKGGKGLTSCVSCFITEINNLAWYNKCIRGALHQK